MIRNFKLPGWLFGKPGIVAVFLICALSTGLFMVDLTPPGQVPDEPAHMIRAAGLLHGAVLAVRQNSGRTPSGDPVETVGVMADPALVRVSFGNNSIINGRYTITAADAAKTSSLPWMQGLIFCGIPNTATYFPAFYLPAAFGLELGRLVGGSPYNCLIDARICMLLVFLMIGAAALWVADYGEAVLLTILLLPMTLFLASSINIDGLLIGSACLCAAIFGKDPARHHTLRIVAIIFLVLITMAKLPYLLLLGMILLPLEAPGLKKRMFTLMLAAVPVLGWAVALALFCIVPFEKPAYHPGPYWTGDPNVLLYKTNPAVNLHILLSHPSLFLRLPVHFIMTNGLGNIHEAIGILGLLNLVFPLRYYLVWLAALAIAMLSLPLIASYRKPIVQTVWNRLYVVGILVLTAWMLMISMYLNWTDVGSNFIDGVQGRYDLVLLPFLILAAMPGRHSFRLSPIIPALPVIALGVFDFGYLPWQFIQHYYLY